MNSPSAQSGKYWLDGRLIRELRDRQGYSQQTFATKADLSKRTLIGIEQQARPAYDTTLDSIYRAFLSIGVTNLERSDLLLNRPEAPLSRANAVASPTPVLGRRLPDFVGRQRQLTQVLEQLTADDGPVNISALRGMGGIGKTTLAVQAGLALAGEYPDGQLLLDLAGLDERPPTPGELMKRVIQVMCPERLKLSDAPEALLAEYLSALKDRRLLLVLDNARDEAQVEVLASAPPPVGIIITSRRALALPGVNSIPLDLLSSGEAHILLRSIVPAKGSDEQLTRLAELAGFLPLALRVAGDFLRVKDDWGVDQYIRALEKERLRYLKVGDGPERDVEAVLKLSSAQLVRDNIDLATKWHCLATWPGDFDLAMAAHTLGPSTEVVGQPQPDPDAVRLDLSQLVNLSLLQYDGAACRYRLHDLLRPIAFGLFG